MLLLHFLPELNSFLSFFLCGRWLWCPFSLICSALVGFLISGQHSTATLLVPAPQTTAEHITAFFFFFFFSFSSTVACFLSFVVGRPADSRQTKPGQYFWSGSVSKSHFQQTWIWRVSCNTRQSSLMPCSVYKPSWYEQLMNKTICCKAGLSLFFHHGDCGHNVIVPLYQTISLFQLPIRVSFA